MLISTLGDRSINKTNNDDRSLTYNGTLLKGTLDASTQFFWLYFSFFLSFFLFTNSGSPLKRPIKQISEHSLPLNQGPGLLPNFMLSNKSSDLKCVTTSQQPIEGKILWHSGPQKCTFLKNILKPTSALCGCFAKSLELKYLYFNVYP